jgi:diguanylate cyclase (GGDEF)-like protein
MGIILSQPRWLFCHAAGEGRHPVRSTPLMPVPVHLAPLKSALPSTEILHSRFLSDRTLKTMILNTMRLSANIDPAIDPLNSWMASAGLSTIVISPLVALIGLCSISLLILGGLWLKGRYPKHTFRRDKSTEKLEERSLIYDYVTSLPTRRLFGTLLEEAVGRAEKTGRPLALLVVELEHFRMEAESQGQAISNVLVRVQAARLKGVVRSTETVARLAPDQFAMILDNLTYHEEIMAIVGKLQATVGLPLTLDGHELFLTCRIGVALYPQDATEHEKLINQAMRAVQTAKSEGQAVQFTSPPVSSAALLIAACAILDHSPVQCTSPPVSSAAPQPRLMASSLTELLQ